MERGRRKAVERSRRVRRNIVTGNRRNMGEGEEVTFKWKTEGK